MNGVKTKNILVKCILIVFILFQVICMSIIGGLSRPGGDEWFTYGLANDTGDQIFMNEKWINQRTEGTGWVSAEDIKSYMFVDEGEEFDFSSVLYNQKKDVHPPLYYMLVHFLCSFTPGEVLMIHGTIINVIFLVAANVILWMMGGELFKSEYERLIPAFVLCLSLSVVELYSYDRMYTMLAFFCLCITCLQLKLRKSMNERKLLILLAVVTCLGCLTHYYFYMYLFAAFMVFAFERLILSKMGIKSMIPCVVSHCIGGITAILLYPKAISHMLFSYRGEQIRDGLFGSKVEGFTAYYDVLNNFCFSGRFAVFFVIIVLLIVIGIVLKKIELGIDSKNIVLLVGTIGLFYFIIAFISYEKVWSYVSPIYVPIALLISIAVAVALWFIPRGYRTLIAMVCLLLLIGTPMLDNVKNTIESNREDSELKAMLHANQGKDCYFVYIYDNQILDLLNFDEIKAVSFEELYTLDLKAEGESRKTKDDMVVFIYSRKNDHVEEQKSYIETSLGKQAEFLYDEHRFSVYVMN